MSVVKEENDLEKMSVGKEETDVGKMSVGKEMYVAEMVHSFSFQLQELPKNMQTFSRCLRSLYVENEVGYSANNATGMNNIRDQTREDAVFYVKGILPLSTQVVRYIQELFEYYEGLELDEWKVLLPDILKEVIGYQQCCTVIVQMHKEMMAPLNKRQDDVKVLISDINNLNKKLMKDKAKVEEEAANSKTWANRLSSIPLLGTFASPLLNKSAEYDLAKGIADGQQVNINYAATTAVRDELIPALANFLCGLNAVASFFKIMERELTTFQGKEDKEVEATKRLHYITMSKKAVEVKRSCKAFYAMIPVVRTDLQCIPEKPGDLNFVDKWLIKQQEQIKRKYYQKITVQLKDLLKHCESTETVQQLAIEYCKHKP